MKNLFFIAILILFCFGCENDEFDIDNPDVDLFVSQIKDGTYDNYEYSEAGEKLWTKMPNFKNMHIPSLINHASDTTILTAWQHMPTNPISSIPPYRLVAGKSVIMLGEYLLWCVEGIINGTGFGSSTPMLVKEFNYIEEGLPGTEILLVRNIYLNWWEEYGQSGNTNILPLEATSYHWR